MSILSGNINSGIYSYSDDVTINSKLTVVPINLTVNSFSSLEDLVTSFPPLTSLTDSGSFVGNYGFLEIRSSGYIYVNAEIDASGKGYIGGNGGLGAAKIFGKVSRGGYLQEIPTSYLGGVNGDPMSEKTRSEVFALDPVFYSLETNRNAVFPGSGGRGGAGAKGGAGGCGGGVVRLISQKGIIFSSAGKVNTAGKRDGGNGTTPGGPTVNCECKCSTCTGTRLDDNWTVSWPSVAAGLGGRGLGTSSGGGAGSCCDTGYVKGIRGWEQCDCHHWSTDSNCDGDWSVCDAGCCCNGNSQSTDYPPTSHCESGGNGNGGAGGGVMMRSYGRIDFQPNNIELNGYVKGYGNGGHGGTLKLFHTGLVPDWIYDPTDLTKTRPSNALKYKIGGFYNEILYSGYCISSSMQVEPLTSIAMKPIGQETIDISFNEGEPEVINDIQVTHGGYEIYRLLDINNTYNFGTSSAPPLSAPEWAYIGTVDYFTDDQIGPLGISVPTEGQVAYDTLGREWTYASPLWTMNVTAAQAQGKFFTATYTDTSLYSFLWQMGYSTDDARKVIQDFLYTKKRLFYRIRPIFYVGGVRLSPCDTNGFPPYTDPKMDVFLEGLYSTPYELSIPSIVGRVAASDVIHYDKFYSDKITNYGVSCVGYDDLYVKLNSPTYWGSFQVTAWDVSWEEGASTTRYDFASVSANTPRQFETSSFKYYTYTEPSMFGRLGKYPYASHLDGDDDVYVVASYNVNAYNSASPTSLSAQGAVVTYEREPTPIFSITLIDNPLATRPESMEVGSNGQSIYKIINDSPNTFHFIRIVSGYVDSVCAVFLDESIARTFALTSWTIDYDRSDLDIATFTLATSTFPDMQVARPSTGVYSHTALSAALYTSPGVYYPTLVVEASTTATGWDLSAVNRIFVYPPSPTASFFCDASTSALTAFVPISFSATDTSTYTGTYAITSWQWLVKDAIDRTYTSDVYTYYTSGVQLVHPWKWHTDNFEQSNITVDDTLENICLFVTTSAWGWRGFAADGGIGTSGLRYEDSPVFGSDTECRHIFLLERPPVAGISAISTYTYTSAFSDDNPNFIEYSGFVSGNYVSGVAPFLDIIFEENSTPKSYPISAYRWNYGDYYSDSLNTTAFELPEGSDSSGWEYPFPSDHGASEDDNYPAWTTTLTDHRTSHLFILPGDYLVTLQVEASTTSTTRQAVLSVHVEENLPTCGFEMSLDGSSWTDTLTPSGTTPLTVYFNATSVVAGSFPIGQLIWDFGDGSPVITIDRYVDNYLNAENGSDPRGYNGGIVQHTYHRHLFIDPDTFTVMLSVVADLSNSVIACSGSNWVTSASGYNVGPISLPAMDADYHLIKSRMFETQDNKVYVLQKESDKSTFNILISGQ